MASEDVIELGSSDDESEPAPKKRKPNAMVHIPSNLHDITIKPTRKNFTQYLKATSINPVTVSKIQNIQGNSLATVNAKLIKKSAPIQNYQGNSLATVNTKVIKKSASKPFMKRTINKPIPVQPSTSINPLNVIKKFTNSQIMINKIPSTTSVIKNPVRILDRKLPPSITITKTTVNKRPPPMSNLIKRKIQPISKDEVLTVELDDDEAPSPAKCSPQWYMRPEDQTTVNSLEEKNNKEPEPNKLIEITIEDSPIKPIPNKRTNEIGSELAITIDDSPVKVIAEKVDTESYSDNEKNTDKKVPQSKKKLEYSKTSNADSIEIEIEPLAKTVDLNIFTKSKNLETSVATVDNIEYTETSTPKTSEQTSASKDNQSTSEPNNLLEEVKNVSKTGEFHPVYQKFIDLCFELENSDDMMKIVEKKIKTYYRQVPKEYVESEEFIDMVTSKIQAMKAGPQKMFLYIKDIVDELNLQRKMAKSQPPPKVEKEEPEKFSYAKYGDYDSKRQRQIRKLEKTIKKLHRAIQKLEEQEVDFDDDEDSVYLLTERYKERMVRVYKKFCQLTNTKMPSEPCIRLEARSGQPMGPIKRLEKWVNKKVPIGTPLPFPDFHDVLRCVRDANEEDKLDWNEAEIMEQARDLFTRCGRKLQRRRQENEWRLAFSRVSAEADPAEINENLQKKLAENRQIASKKETDVLNKYADRQKQLKLEAEEIGDKEAEESPIESEDEDTNDVTEGNSLEDKEKRKKRLRRLLQEKSKRNLPEDTETVDKSKKQELLNAIEVEKSTNKDKEEGSKNIENDYSESLDVNLKIEAPLSKTETKCNDTDKVHSLSDDSNKVDSDVDELHLLQKLHSENEVNSSAQNSSDSESPIAISDSLESSSDLENKGKIDSDVISIENSSYSESEMNKVDDLEGKVLEEIKEDCIPIKDVVEEIVDSNVEIECSTAGVKKRDCKTFDEKPKVIDNVLLASSDEELNTAANNECATTVNIKNDFPEGVNARIENPTAGVNSDSEIINANPNKIVDNILLPSSDDEANPRDDNTLGIKEKDRVGLLALNSKMEMKCVDDSGNNIGCETTNKQINNVVDKVLLESSDDETSRTVTDKVLDITEKDRDDSLALDSKMEIKCVNNSGNNIGCETINKQINDIVDKVLLESSDDETSCTVTDKTLGIKEKDRDGSLALDSKMEIKCVDDSGNNIGCETINKQISDEVDKVLLESSDDEISRTIIDNSLCVEKENPLTRDTHADIKLVEDSKNEDGKSIDIKLNEIEDNVLVASSDEESNTVVANDSSFIKTNNDGYVDDINCGNNNASITDISESKDNNLSKVCMENDVLLEEKIQEQRNKQMNHNDDADLISINSTEEVVDEDCKILDRHDDCDSVNSFKFLQDESSQNTIVLADDAAHDGNCKQNDTSTAHLSDETEAAKKSPKCTEKKDCNLNVAEESNSIDFLEIRSVEELDCISIDATACDSVETNESHSIETMESNSIEDESKSMGTDECKSVETEECKSVETEECRSIETEECNVVEAGEHTSNKAEKCTGLEAKNDNKVELVECNSNESVNLESVIAAKFYVTENKESVDIEVTSNINKNRSESFKMSETKQLEIDNTETVGWNDMDRKGNKLKKTNSNTTVLDKERCKSTEPMDCDDVFETSSVEAMQCDNFKQIECNNILNDRSCGKSESIEIQNKEYVISSYKEQKGEDYDKTNEFAMDIEFDHKVKENNECNK